MSECEQAGRLSAYHDDQMPPQAREEFQRHLGQCPACAAELERLRRLTGLLASLPVCPMPEGMLPRLHRAVDRLPTVTVRRMAEVLDAVAAVILAVSVIGLARQAPSQAAPGTMPIWETQALAQPSQERERERETTSGGTEELLASWMVQDLSWKEGR
jgi:anti-sigma factor RsiW